MFFIQGTAGQTFKGTLEDLVRIRQLSHIRPARPGEEEAFVVPPPTGGRHGPQEEAIRAYRSQLAPDLERGPLYHAGQIMSRSVVTVQDSDRVAEAWRVLRDRRIRQAPVLDDGGRLVGIVGDRDLLTTINIDHGEVFDMYGRAVADVMTTPVVAAAPVTDIRRIASVMLDHGVDGVPVLDEAQHLIGFISRSDILRAVITDPPLSLWR